MTKLSNLALCYEGIQRIYRNTLVAHLRMQLKQAFPADYLEKARSPFQKEWEKIRAAAEERRLTGELDAALIDDIDVLGVNHFSNLFDLFSTVLLPNLLGTDEEKKKAKKALLGWMQSVKALRDPLSHPAEADLSFEDAFVLLDYARRVLTQLAYPEAAAALQTLSSRLSGRVIVDDQQPLEDRLPPRESIVVDFVGRSAELADLKKWFDDPLARRWVLVGEGGLGKSALAYAFAAEIRGSAPPPFQLVAWMSAKVRRFQDGSTVPVNDPDFSDLDSALTRLLMLYGWQDESRLPIDTKRAYAIELLNSFPALLVVDDIDSLEGAGEDAIEFFTIIAPQTKSKVLLTSRRTILGLGHSVTQVSGLPEGDAVQFIRSRYDLLGLDLRTLDKIAIKEIIEACGSSPLYMEDLVRLVAVMPLNRALSEWKSRSGDEARKYALGREIDKLSTAGREVLAAACAVTRAITFSELQALTGQTDDALSSSLRELQRLFLVPKPRLIDGEDRYEVGINTRVLVQRVLEHTDLWRRIQAAHAAISDDMQWKFGREEVRALIRKAILLVRIEQQEDAETLIVRGSEKHPNDPNLLGILGFIYKAWRPPRRTDAREKFTRALQLKSRDKEMYKHWVQMELADREWSLAASAAESGLRLLHNNPMLHYFAGYAKSRLGKELKAGLRGEKAREALQKAHAHLAEALANSTVRDDYLRRDIYRALALNWEALEEEKKTFEVLEAWRKEHPEDDDAVSEYERLTSKFDRKDRMK